MIGSREVRHLLKVTGWKQRELAQHTGVQQATVSRWLKGSIPDTPQQEVLKRLMEQHHLAEAEEVEEFKVPVVGTVGAGASIERYQSDSHGELSRVVAPEGASESTVAAEIHGESLGSFFDRWLVFYDEIYDPPAARLAGQLCVCGVADGRVLVKKLKRGTLPGTWTLLSQFEAPIYDVFLEWAAPVITMRPQ